MLLFEHSRCTPASGALYLLFSVLNIPPPYILPVLVQKKTALTIPRKTTIRTAGAYSVMFPGSISLFRPEGMGGEVGRKINTSLAQDRGPAWTSNETEPGPKECDKSNPAYLILVKEATSVVKM